MKPSDIARFEAKYDRRGPDDCWPWTGAISSKGYGNFFYNNQCIGPHRFARALADGIEIPDWHVWEIDHTCENKLCMNPSHLDWVARAGRINSVRHQERRLKDRVACPSGHPWTTENLYRHTYPNGKHYTACRLCRNKAAAACHERRGT